MIRIGSLFSGAGGLDMAVEQVFGGTVAWHCELDSAASKVLAHRWPGVLNLGDITKADWDAVEPVDILCGGWPCQPFSLAGQRKGADDDRALWPFVARTVRMVRPRIVVLENVSAVLGPEFQRVADSLAEIGYVGRWTCLRASDVGAPHRRERLFIIATDADKIRRATGDRRRGVQCAGRDQRISANPPRDGRHEGRPEPARPIGRSDAAVSGDGPLLPTPAVNDIGEGKTVEWWDEWTAKSKAKHGNGNGHGNSLAIEALRMGGDGPVELLPTPTAVTRERTPTEVAERMRTRSLGSANLDETVIRDFHTALLPTPNAADGQRGQDFARAERDGSGGDDLVTSAVKADRDQQWGTYEPAIRRWENLTRPAPAPTEPNKNGNPRLSAAFSEWMMGWPAGHVTEAPGISRNDQLRIIGNGVVPQCAEVAIRYLLSVSEAAA